MYGINEIKKQNAQNKADSDHSAIARFTALRDGGVLLHCNGIARTLEKGRDDEAIAKFFDKVRGKTSGQVANIVREYFKTESV